MTTEVEKANNDNLVTETFIVKPENIDELCRLCANTDNQLMPIFSGEGLEHKIINKIRQHLPIIKVTEKDRLPLSICYHCASNLIAWHSLYEGCKLADTRLRELIGEKDGKKNIENDDVQSDKRSYDSFDYDSVHIAYDEDSNDNEISRSEVLEDIIQVTSANTDAKKADGNYKPILEDVAEVVTPDEATLEEDDMITGDIEVDDGDSNIIIETEGLELENLTEEQILRTVPDPIVDSFEIQTSKDRPFFCNICGFTFKRLDHVRSHKRWVHERVRNTKFECNLCGKVLKTASGVAQHLLRHKGEKPFVCEYCDKKFYSNCYLLRHYQYHLEQSVPGGFLPCPKCDNKYVNEEQVRFHLMWHDMTEECEVCKKRFKTKKQLFCHMRCHNKHKPFRCNDCGQQFQIMKSLVAHKKKHIITGRKVLPEVKKSATRSYRCDICSLTYKSEMTYKKHREIHFSDKNFHCKICDLRFTTEVTFKQHETQHKKEKDDKIDSVDNNKTSNVDDDKASNAECSHYIIVEEDTFDTEDSPRSLIIDTDDETNDKDLEIETYYPT